jgi:DNA-binding SARP family transcriptional activator
LALALEALLPDSSLRQVVALALVAAHRRLMESGATAAHALTRSLRPVEPIDRIERLLLLARCSAARRRPWSLSRCVAALEALTAWHDRAPTVQDHAYGLLALGMARGLAGLFQEAADALRSCLDVLVLDGGSDVHTASIRLSAHRALVVAEHQLGHLAEAERLCAEAEAQARVVGTPYIQLELANNRAVLLQQRGAHAESADLLRSALASPWSAERSLRPLLYASLADALDALGDRDGSAQALHTALEDLHVPDVYGLQGHVHAMRALLLVESGHAAAAKIEIAAGAPPTHPATCLARALLHDPLSPEARPALQEALDAAGSDVPLYARVQAHMARVCALQGDRPRAQALADALVHDQSYPLTPREAAILGPHTSRVHPARPPAAPVGPAPAPITVRFFGAPMLYIGGQPLGNAAWMRSKGRELLWYALAHGSAGFTREEAWADLFPDMDGEAGSRALRNLLYELRKLLRTHCGVDTFRASADGRLRLRPEDLGPARDVDTRTLETWLAHLRAGEMDAVGDLPLLLGGHYLADLQADWTRPFRYYWEREAVHALDLAATHFERAGRAAEALACLRREVAFCPDDTVVVRRLMVLYHALGDVGGLRATYLAHRRTLHEELEVAPDRDLIALYETLTRP